MNRRALGRTGLQVSEIGYGAWGIGGSMWLGAEDEESLRALHRAADLGLNLIDTAAPSASRSTTTSRRTR